MTETNPSTIADCLAAAKLQVKPLVFVGSEEWSEAWSGSRYYVVEKKPAIYSVAW